MKYFATMLLLNTGVACSQSKNSPVVEITDNKTEENKIIEVIRLLTQLMIERDTKAMNNIVDKDFTLTHITGYVQSKAEWFHEIETESMKYYSYKEVKTSVKIEGDKAIFVGQNLLDARIWGSRNAWRLQQKMELEKRDDNWIILHSVATTF
ncbi:nuclear transport factor 2 family protein [Ferruginibacter profundus]